MTYRNMVLVIQILVVIGFILSLYTFVVEKRRKKDKNYKPACDISDKISCTKAFSSKYGKTFGLSNYIYGMIFYVVILLLTLDGLINYIFYISILAVLGSVYLAYVLYFKVKSFCLVCNGIYLVNVLLLVFSYLEVY